MRKFMIILCTIALLVGTLTGCAGDAIRGGSGGNPNTAAGNGTPAMPNPPLKVLSSVFPIYDWTNEVTAGCKRISSSLLVDTGADMHNFQPTTFDIARISNCDVFIYVGGESDEWVASALDEANNPDMKVICLMNYLADAVLEETDEGILQGEEEHHEHDDANHEHEEGEGETHHEHEEGEGEAEHHEDEDEDSDDFITEIGGGTLEGDEHIWLSLRNAYVCTASITYELMKLCPNEADLLYENAEKYVAQLKALDDEYVKVCDDCEEPYLLIADRFPFAYLMDDYDIAYNAAFSGCSAESEASFSTIVELIDIAAQKDVPGIVILDGSDRKLADTVIAGSGCDADVYVLDSLQAVTKKDIANGKNYLDTMTSNLKVLQQLLK